LAEPQGGMGMAALQNEPGAEFDLSITCSELMTSFYNCLRRQFVGQRAEEKAAV